MVSMPAKYKYDLLIARGSPIAGSGSGTTGPNFATFIHMHQAAQFQVVDLKPLPRRGSLSPIHGYFSPQALHSVQTRFRLCSQLLAPPSIELALLIC